MMIISTNNGYFLIRHFRSDIIMTILSAVLAINVGIVDYKLTFDSTFKVQRRMLLLHKELTNYVGQQKSLDSNTKQLMKGRTESVVPVGIRVGSFYTVERDSTLQYIDFVSVQLVNLLVTLC